jgi:hypothetical protein
MIVTALTQRFGVRHPIVLAPMGAVSGRSGLFTLDVFGKATRRVGRMTLA